MKAPRQKKRAGGKYNKRYIPPDREWLEYHFITLDMSTVEIAEMVGTSDVTVLKWLHAKKLGRTVAEAMIRTRGRRGEGRSSYNYEARRLLQEAAIPQQCVWCGALERIEVHHIDHDWHNQSLDNLQWMCVPCHRLEGRLWANRKFGKLEFYQEGDEIHIILLREDR